MHRNSARLRHSRHLDKASIHSDNYRSDDGIGQSYSPYPVGGPPTGTRLTIQDNHKPMFTNCSRYQPTVKEEENPDVFVFQVTAADKDPPENGGKITYTFVSNPGERVKFNIDPDTGIIRTNKHMFDRDEPSREKEVYLTVRATDNGRPRLDDVCTIKVTIEDINDNTPVFDKVNYVESVPQDLAPGREVMRISATDIDDGNNSIVLYDLEPRVKMDDKYFHIDRNTGVIFLDKPIDKDPNYRFRMRATATDQGTSPNSATIDLEVLVVESHKKAPVFTSIPASPIILKENLTDYSYNIATLSAMSNTDEEAPVFDLVKGRTEQTNKDNTFRLVPEGTTAHIRLAGHMDYESINEYSLTVRIQNKYSLAAETSLTIQLEDVNDNIPIFTEVASGSVLENEPPGTPVMQVRAIDADSTSEHNQVTYELADNTDYFAIDKYTGNITTKVTFDREKQDFYNVKVIATDNSPSALYSTGEHNKGQQVFRIEIADKNDHPPRFTLPVYVAEAIPEDANQNYLVTEIKAEDNDTASPVTYSIVEGNTGNAFLIEPKTGKIRVNSHLDYENITSYTLRVRAFDGAYEDFCRVEIKIENVNDNPPVFLNYQNNFTIEEEKLIPGCIVQLEAYDPDIPDRSAPQRIVYFVVKQDQQKLLTIDKNGCLSLIKPLDRDQPNGFEIWQVLVAASDEDGGPSSLRGSTEVVITLTDINDNAPFLDMVQPVIWRENQHPGPITKLVAKDYDGPENGPPFSFSIASSASSEIQSKFGVNGEQLMALVTFDREEKKSYNIPIAITDSGHPPMTGTSTLLVVIGDVNDNKMKAGESSIFIYNYKGEAPDTEIGRVYVDDPDDWDVGDKSFDWAIDSHPNFDLNHDTGMITMRQGIMEQSYLLTFKVTEEALLIPRHTVDAVVNVTIKIIPEEAVDKSGSIRFSDITAEEFVSPDSKGISKHNVLKWHLSKLLNTSIDNVDVFTVLHSPHNVNQRQLDVRFSAHGSPYYEPERINAAITEHQNELEKALGAKILMVNIDECMLEKQYCEADCTNFLNKSNVPSPVYTNTTSFVGVRAIIDPLCNCRIIKKNTVCYNGGTPVGEVCECPEGFEGPHCEILGIGFWGEGWALYPPLPSCLDSHLSLQLRSNKPDGLVFYIGPTTNKLPLPVQDFMSLELQGGYPVLLVDFGTGTARVEQKQIRLTDGETHRIDIIWTNASIELQVDNCKRQNCLTLAIPVGSNKFLNVNGPLQVGGTHVDLGFIASGMNWTHKPRHIGFDGCVQNLTFNNKLYNLGMPSLSKNVDLGCNRGMAVAVTFGIDPSFLVAIFICLLILLILLLAVLVHRRKTEDLYKDTDDIRENIINYEDEGGGEGDTAYDLNVLRLVGPYDEPLSEKQQPPGTHLIMRPGPDEVPDIHGFLDVKKQTVDNDPETNPFDDVRHYAYEGDGNTTGSLSSLASGTDEADLNFDYLSNFGPRFRKLADMYGEDPSDEEDNYHNAASESWC
ncbi:DE-cadherin-like [Lycorma delicatula]|uniref:DE-cadherin-like n=1 Tax=Lycorma delicatula TaxID=130591 RepID=UPI003F50EAC0